MSTNPDIEENVVDNWEDDNNVVETEQLRRALKEREKMQAALQQKTKTTVAGSSTKSTVVVAQNALRAPSFDSSSSSSESDGEETQPTIKVMQRHPHHKHDVNVHNDNNHDDADLARANRLTAYEKARERIFGNASSPSVSQISTNDIANISLTEDPPMDPAPSHHDDSHSSVMPHTVTTADNQQLIVRPPPPGIRKPVPSSMPLRQRAPMGRIVGQHGRGHNNATGGRYTAPPQALMNMPPFGVMPPPPPQFFMPPMTTTSVTYTPSSSGIQSQANTIRPYGCPPPFMHHTMSAPALSNGPQRMVMSGGNMNTQHSRAGNPQNNMMPNSNQYFQH